MALAKIVYASMTGNTEEIADIVAKKLEDELDYPGQIKVNVIRELRSVEYAK